MNPWFLRLRISPYWRKMFYGKFPLWLTNFSLTPHNWKKKKKEKGYQSNCTSKILRFLLNSLRWNLLQDFFNSLEIWIFNIVRLRIQKNNNTRISLFRNEIGFYTFYFFFLFFCVASNLRSRAKIFHLLNIKKFNVLKI